MTPTFAKYFAPLYAQFNYCRASQEAQRELLDILRRGKGSQEHKADFPGLKGFIDQVKSDDGNESPEKIRALLAVTRSGLTFQQAVSGFRALGRAHTLMITSKSGLSEDVLRQHLNFCQEVVAATYPTTLAYE